MAVDDNGDVLSSTDPSGGAGAWHLENLIPYPLHLEEGQPPQNSLRSASCASASLCALVGSESRIFTSTEPVLSARQPLLSARQSYSSPGPQGWPRPRTILGFANPFWKINLTARGHIRARAFASSRPARPWGSNASATAAPTAAVAHHCATG